MTVVLNTMQGAVLFLHKEYRGSHWEFAGSDSSSALVLFQKLVQVSFFDFLNRCIRHILLTLMSLIFDFTDFTNFTDFIDFCLQGVGDDLFGSEVLIFRTKKVCNRPRKAWTGSQKRMR